MLYIIYMQDSLNRGRLAAGQGQWKHRTYATKDQ